MRNNVMDYLDEIVRKVPEKLAFSNGTEGMTFAEVDLESKAVGTWLHNRKVYREPVVVFMNKHPKEVTAFFGVVRGGCFYVPIDEEMPRARIDLILENLKPRVILCDDGTAEVAKTFACVSGVEAAEDASGAACASAGQKSEDVSGAACVLEERKSKAVRVSGGWASEDASGTACASGGQKAEKISGAACASGEQRTAEIVRYDEICRTEADEAALWEIHEKAIDTDPIYVVFTSGSTGVPKGVAACHRSVLDYVEQLSEVLEFGEDTVYGNQTPLYFDACLKELYPTLKFGATTYLIPKELFLMPVKLVEFLNEYRINTVCWVVSALTMISAFNTFQTIVPQYLRTVAFGSEVFPIRQFRRWREALPEAKFTNLYGPTEGTGMCCYFKVERDFALEEAIPIGRPFKNTEILLIKEDQTPAGPGETGEICIRGTSLTLGYYNNFEKTNEVFVQNPLNTAYPELIYRTGDLGRYNDRGELVFVSRKDYQIKHMGHRIELGEIEANVNVLEGVKTAGCIYDGQKGKIVLYYVGETEEKELVSLLKDRLPRYMLPNYTRRLEQMPFTANGKIDRVALAAMHRKKQGQAEGGAAGSLQK